MIIAALLLSSLGIAVIYSSSPQLAIQQGIFTLIGLIFYFLISYMDYRALKPIVNWSYFITLALLIIVFIIGYETRGSTRWISLGVFNLQPSEFAKVALILSLAKFWESHLPSWRNILLSFIIALPFLGLIFRQPDLGTALTIGSIWLGILFASNISFWKLSLMSMIGIGMLPIGWLFLREYQKQRVMSFLYPQYDPLGAGYNVIQSTIAVGSGEILGRGLGQGTQSRLQFLPEFRTDFIFASIAEELGALGSLIVLALYASLFYFFFYYLNKVGDRFGEIIIVGVFSMIIFQMIVNIGMNIGIMPVTGITLPLLSYGGSSVVTTYIALGFIGSVARFGVKRDDVDVIG